MANKLNEDADGNVSSKRVWGGRAIGTGLLISIVAAILHMILASMGKNSQIDQIYPIIYACYTTGGGLLGVGLIERFKPNKPKEKTE